MTPFNQLVKHDPINGLYGDCLRTAFACLLDVPPQGIPNWAADFADKPADEMWSTIKEWLYFNHNAGYFIIGYPGDLPRNEILASVGNNNPGVNYLLIGASPGGTGHVVVCCDDAVVHDPSWTKAGVTQPMDDLWIILTLVPSVVLNVE